MLAEVIRLLDPSAGQTFVDRSVGRDGRALAIADRLGTGRLLIALEADPRYLNSLVKLGLLLTW